MIGKPYSGKPNVRFDEGELEIELLATIRKGNGVGISEIIYLRSLQRGSNPLRRLFCHKPDISKFILTKNLITNLLRSP